MDLVDALEAGRPVQIKGINLAARSLPQTSLPEGYQLGHLNDEARAALQERYALSGEGQEALAAYLFLWRELEDFSLHTMFDRLLRRSAVEDAIVAVALVNLESTVPVTVIGDMWISPGAKGTHRFNELTMGVDEERGIYPDQAYDYRLPAEMHGHFRRSLAATNHALQRVMEDAKAANGLTIALRQWALANDEFAGHFTDEWLVDPLLRFMVTLEALLGDGPTQLTRTLRQRGAILSGPSPDDAVDADEAIARCYSLRSKYVHGQTKRPNREDVSTARATVATVLRNWIVVAAAWLDSGERFGDLPGALDTALLHPSTYQRVVSDPLIEHGRKCGSPLDE